MGGLPMASEPTAQAPEGANSEASTSDTISVPPIAREILENYSSIPSDEVVPHVLRIRDRALQVFPHARIGRLHFLNFYFAMHPLYPEIVTRLRDSSHKFLDMGCCFGQSIRNLVYDGAPSASLYGIDIEDAFISLGYEFFKDREKLDSKFIQGDIFDMDLTPVLGNIDVLQASAFFHLFTRSKQVLAIQKMISILRPVAGSVVVGASLGSAMPGEHELAPGGPSSFRHDPESFAELWMEASLPGGSQWKVESSLDTVGVAGKEHMPWAEPNMRRIVFTVTRM